MRNYYSSPIMRRIHDRLALLYGPAAPRLLSRFAMMIGRYAISAESRPPMPSVNQRACLLIAYADTLLEPSEPSLTGLCYDPE